MLPSVIGGPAGVRMEGRLGAVYAIVPRQYRSPLIGQAISRARVATLDYSCPIVSFHDDVGTPSARGADEQVLAAHFFHSCFLPERRTAITAKVQYR